MSHSVQHYITLGISKYFHSIILEVIVTEKDRGVVIGKSGNTAKAIRTLVQAHAYILGLNQVKINIDSF